MINWDDPAARLRLVDQIGIDAYNKAMLDHFKKSVVATVAGRDIRPVGSRFGQLFVVDGTDRAFKSLGQAKQFARDNPA